MTDKPAGDGLGYMGIPVGAVPKRITSVVAKKTFLNVLRVSVQAACKCDCR